MRHLADRLISGYQRFLSPALGPHCRFHPTCSEYARQSIRRFGTVRGTWLGLRRICRCHPLCAGGEDPVPLQYRWFGRAARVPGEGPGEG